MAAVAGEPNAVTRITLIERLDAAGDGSPAPLARYRLEPLTGRKHQLRAQLSALGRPIVGDRIYPVLQPADDPAAPDYNRPLQLLARELGFVDPLSGALRHYVSRRRLAGPGG
jgi:tRNA pseudouridine32 synthase/23S rRNA pseudouridine746 synthase